MKVLEMTLHKDAMHP